MVYYELNSPLFEEYEGKSVMNEILLNGIIFYVSLPKNK
jgi:hypothetical protein